MYAFASVADLQIMRAQPKSGVGRSVCHLAVKLNFGELGAGHLLGACACQLSHGWVMCGSPIYNCLISRCCLVTFQAVSPSLISLIQIIDVVS